MHGLTTTNADSPQTLRAFGGQEAHPVIRRLCRIVAIEIDSMCDGTTVLWRT